MIGTTIAMADDPLAAATPSTATRIEEGELQTSVLRLTEILDRQYALTEAIVLCAREQRDAILRRDAEGLNALTTHLGDASHSVLLLERERDEMTRELAERLALEEPTLTSLGRSVTGDLRTRLEHAGERLLQSIGAFTQQAEENQRLLGDAITEIDQRLQSIRSAPQGYGRSGDLRTANTSIVDRRSS